jgi:hypothetical protein
MGTTLENYECRRRVYLFCFCKACVHDVARDEHCRGRRRH